MVQSSSYARLRGTRPAYIFFSVVLVVSAYTARAQEVLDDSLPLTARVGHIRPFGSSSQISGTVNFEGDGGPAPGIAVTIRSMMSSETHSVITDPAGHFQIDGLPFGPYMVTAEAVGYEPATSTTSVDRSSAEVSLYLKSVNGSPSREGMPTTVSVRELKIPPKAQNFYEKGLQRLNKDPAESAQYFTKAIDKYAEYYEAYYELGQAQRRLNQPNEAMESFQKSIDLSGGKFAQASFAFGLLLCNQGKAQEAERIVRSGLEHDSNMPYGHLAMGVILLHLRRPAEAEKSANEVLLRNAHIPDAYLVLADAHGAQNNYAAEVNDLDAFLKLVPDGPRSDLARGLRKAADRLAHEGAQRSQSSQMPQRPDVLNIEPTKP